MKQIKLSSSLFYLILVFVSLIATYFVLKLHTAPFVFVGLIWIITILFLSLVSKRNFLNLIGINLSAVILALTIFEGYLWIKRGEPFIKINHKILYRTNNILGYVPKKGQKATINKFYKDKLIYSATYTINEKGFRITPSSNNFKIKGCVLFFGGSFTFGEGVSDSESVPYQVGLKSKGKYCIYNFGVNGYGPHQMLSELENNIVKKIVYSKGKMYAIYEAIDDHIRRVAGLAWWDNHGPRYILEKNGNVKFDGNFNDANTLPEVITKYLEKSLLYRDMITRVGRFFNENKDVELFMGIILLAKKNFEKLYPGGEFHVIIWDDSFKKNISKILHYFKVNGIIVHLISTIIPDYKSNRFKYILSPYENHPNALTDKVIAEYITNNILEK